MDVIKKRWTFSHTFVSIGILLIKLLSASLYFHFQMHSKMDSLIKQQFLLIETVSHLKVSGSGSSVGTAVSARRYTLDASPFAEHVKRISAEAKLTLKNIVHHIMRDEGVRPEPYPDTIGVAIGVGRNLTTYGLSTVELRALNGQADVNEHLDAISIGDKRVYIDTVETAKKLLDTPLTDHEISLLLLSNLRNTVREAERVFGDQWDRFDSARKEAIIDMLFNLGLPTFEMFKKTIASLRAADFEQAAENILLSRAAQQNPARYQRIAQVIRTGDVSYFEVE